MTGGNSFGDPTALVLLASEQLWPNIHSIEFWAKTLKYVFIYHTANAGKSVEPARKLARFCNERHSLNAEFWKGDGSPQDIANCISDLLERHPEASWLINATGGTKLMFDGAAWFRDRVRVVYREITNRWYELCRAPNGMPSAQQINVSPGVTDQIPVELLLRAIWETDALNLEFGPPPDRLAFPDITRELVETNGNWKETFARVGSPLTDNKSGGDPFERYVAAALLEMELNGENITHSVKQRGPKFSPGQATQEIDIVANHDSRLLVFDCKLRTEEEEGREVETITSQIRQAAHTARQLGGLGAEVVLLRPNREITGTIRDLADDLRVRVIDKDDRGCFFRKLAEFVRCRLPDSLRCADELLSEPGNARRAFTLNRAMGAMNRASRGSPVIELEPLCGEWSRETGPEQDWTVVRIRGPLFYLQYANRRGVSRHRLEVSICRVLEEYGRVFQIDLAKSGNTLYALLAVEQDNESRYRRFLASRVGKPLVE